MKKIQQSYRPLSNPYLVVILLICLFIRFIYPFLNPPIDHTAGLPGRQWEQAGNFWQPNFMAGVDSFLYQAWLGSVRWISDDSLVLSFFSGLLCFLMPIGWYLCAKRLLPSKWALWFGILCSCLPSFFTIYAYFAAETLLLVLMGFASWQTAKTYQEGNKVSFLAMGCLWILAGMTRLVAMPIGLACIFLCMFRIARPALSLIPLVIFAALIIGVSAWHSHRAIGIYAPFGMPQMNAILARSGGVKMYIAGDMVKKNLWFRSPSYSVKPLLPFNDWQVTDRSLPPTLTLIKENGLKDWNKAIKQYPLSIDIMKRQIALNSIFLLFGPSWPDSWPNGWSYNGDDYNQLESKINYHSRLIWPLLISFVIIGGFFYRGDKLNYLLIILTTASLLMLLVQTTSVFEGRYRKPVEPLILLSSIILCHSYTLKYQRKNKL